VAGVNRVGNDPACQYCGGSVVIDPYGKTIAACTDNLECEATATIDIEALQAFRAKFPVLNDAD
jgi:predicted amidohydrolase